MTSNDALGLAGVDRIVFAVEDFAAACRFATDWGLESIDAGPDEALFATVDGAEVLVLQADAAREGRRPVGSASGMTELVWGVADEGNLDAIAAELGCDRAVEMGADGILRSHDDLGFGIGFRVSRRRKVPFEPSAYNAPGHPERIDRRAARYRKARPHEISHVAIGVDAAGEASRFYVERLGFHVSDRYADRGVFMRCAAQGNHHHLFLMNGRVPGTRFNHLAFKVRDIHEVIAGGQFIDAQGWRTFAGPGRHIVSSANFWYFTSPFGGAWEYAADEDMVTEAWEAQDFAAEAHIFSEWTFGLEKSDGTLRGPIADSAARPGA
jgi:catechol 2,3-dioxygenase-like lactoylglutathione lyase family enzyme